MTRRMIVRASLTTAALAACLGIITSVEVSTASGGGLFKALSSPLKSFRVGKGLPDLPRVMERRTIRSTSNAVITSVTIATDRADYLPGDTAWINGTGFAVGETVTLRVVHSDGTAEGGEGHEPWNVIADEFGEVHSTWYVATDDSLGSKFTLTATGAISGSAQATFTDAGGNPSANLDQCANDPLPSSHFDGCDTDANQWVNGNLGASKSVYLEGDSIPYRMRFDNLNTAASHTVIIEWDTTKSGKHALDYLTTFNRTVATANPCLGVSGCNPGTFDFRSIPADSQVTGAGVTPVAGAFRLYGGTITNIGTYSYPNGTGFVGDKSARIAITFTTGIANPVLAWGGHIASRKDWPGASAINIPGSPYHMRLIDLDGSGGNQDRSLSADAVIFPGSITIMKDAVPNDAQDFSFTASPAPLSNFSLDDDADATLSNTQAFTGIVNFQTYTVTEATTTGWDLTSVVCTVTDANGGTQSGSTTTRTATIGLKEGENVTCTFTNTLQKAHLKLVKTVTNDNGGTAKTTDFTLSAAGPTPLSGSGGAEGDVDAGSYTLSETSVPGYTAGSWSCSGGTFTSPDKIALAAGQSATCTINNNDQTAHLKLVKTVTNDNGGKAVATDFTLSAAGPTPISGAGGAESDVNAGSYTLSETSVTGYTPGNWSCSGGTFTAPDKIAVALGESATCTINNNDNGAHLKLVKTVTNDNGGTAVVTDFTLSAAGPSPISGAGGAESDVNAGSYTLSETSVAGYTAGSWSCSGGTFTAPDKIALALGQSATCTINNNDQTAHLKLVKTVTNDNGGTAVATDFTLSAAGPTPLSGAGGAEKDVNAGSYTLSETSVAGYTAGSWSCSGGTFTAPDKIALALGQSATCTINNNDQTAHLKLLKTVTNDNGGTAATTDFTLSAAGPTPISGAGYANSDVNAGSYTLSETTLPGYTAGSWSCTGGTFTAPDKIALALGQSATCTINNNDQTAHLKLVKTVTNDNGGTAKTTDFTLTAAGPTPLSGAGGAENDVNAGTYNLSETNVAGYTAGSWSCVGGTQNGASVTLAVGQSATCTINNNDQTAHLKLVKYVTNNNGGTAKTTDFTLSAAGPTPLSGAGVAESDVSAGSYSLSETNLPGYAASAWSCTGGTFTAPNSIALALGQSATCRITNDDIAPKLHLRKVVINDNGGTKTVADFTLTANGTGSNDLSGTSPVDSTATLQADTWALSETNVYGYTASAWSCVGGSQSGSNITVGIGGEATCTITNDDKPGTIIVQKIVKPVGSSTSFSFQTTGTGYNVFNLAAGGTNSQNLNAGSYTVKELVPLGWVLTGIGGSTDVNTPYNCTITGSGGSTGVGDLTTQTASISLKNGDTVTCVFENTGVGATRTQGFWATHLALTSIAWTGGSGFGHNFPGVGLAVGDISICGQALDVPKVMGAFWSDISKTSTGVKRSPLGQAKMQLLQQLLAAELNASAFGSAPSGGVATFTAWENALCGTNAQAIKDAQQGAASFNSFGDSSTFTPGTSADSKTGRQFANYVFWDMFT